MTNNLLPLFFVAVLAGCGTKESSDAESTAVTAPELATGSEPQCYALMASGDTVRLNLNRQGNKVTGTLVYQLAEKDSNTGTLRGHMRGDTLLATYTFQSEGQTSVREVAFLTQNGGFVEGFGPVQEQNGAMLFTPGTTITFNAERVLTKTYCLN